ncbi:hypothetical protein jhhlp_006827 [Lomentospora prolificans]|uniref:FAD-binding PCMH-type domain-containing protein n=1 Tax=Lomentospora prolificans TaxID=41688 RepID=A0A2N3N2V5_9PEZI|nr:hypothetical protein jhhlp_006827 [Lomentospora prolificans]
MRKSVIVGGLAPLLLPSASARASYIPIRECMGNASVPFDVPDSDDWALDVAPFNERLPYTPIAIAVPRTVEHIEDAVKCAVGLGVKVAAKCGGHSYASLGLGGEDGHLVIEMDRMHDVTLSEDGETAVIQGGARLGHVATELWEQGGRAISHGTCPGVGISGHALHGGFGMSSYTHGLALDWILSATVVLANGTTVRASADENADLFWALRGAGGSMGIVAEYEFATFEPVEEYTHFEATLNWTDPDSIVDGWLELQAWGEEEMPREMNMRFSVDMRGVMLDGLYHGSQSDMEDVVLPLLERVGGGVITSNVTFDWFGQLGQYAYTKDLNLTHPYNQHETFYAKSLFTHALPREAIASFISYTLTNASAILQDTSRAQPAKPSEPGEPSADPPRAQPPFLSSRFWWILVDIHGGANSYVSQEVAHDSTSYAHRDKLLLFQFYDRSFGAYPPGEEPFKLLDGFVDSITAHLDEGDWGMYINYADPRVEDVAEEVYWGENVERLRGIKREFDPDDVFSNPLGIKPAV